MADNHQALFFTVRLLSTIVLFSDALGQKGMIKQYYVAALSERCLATLQTRKSEVREVMC